ncbi:hypothetical protein GMOD_00000652 [Pyrenophora seminiperda CCB06]|uniref:Uncharacterized protein n=1 Tax=Pyrenophora seminiperda CCB06 TaxID=1302712 RepID=A0A3M7M7P4_9PLEO|nr:hypothetical protein GMOD_00000652 [Pyrenophora seminiperda CCB06]
MHYLHSPHHRPPTCSE